MNSSTQLRGSILPEEAERVRSILARVIESKGSEAEAARFLGVSQQNINKIMKGGAPGLMTIRHLAERLDMPLEELMRAEHPLDEVVSRYPIGRWSQHVLAYARSRMNEELSRREMKRAVENETKVVAWLDSIEEALRRVSMPK